MAVMYTEALPEIGAVRVVLDVSDMAALPYEAQVQRLTVPPQSPNFFDYSTTVRVRPTFIIDGGEQGGYPWEMISGGVDVWYDTEAPLDTPVWYSAELPGATTPFVYARALTPLVTADFESGVTGWTAEGGATLTAETADPITGTRSLRLTVVGTPTSIGVHPTARSTVVAGRRYLVEAMLRASSTTGLVRLAVDWYTAGDVFLSTSFGSTATPAANTDTYRRALLLAPATAARADVRVVWSSNPPTGGALVVDDVRFADTGDGIGYETSTSLVLPSNDGGWLSDPELPALDVRLDLLPGDGCEIAPAPAGVLFLSHSAETRQSTGTRFDVIDQAAPAIVTGRRKLPTATLTAASLSQADRTKVDNVLTNGDVLMLRVPAEFGVTDRYLDVGDTVTSPLSPDLRLPYRVHDLPYAQASIPGGPAGGVLGVQFQDLDRYPTWVEFDAANLTSLDLLHGAGSTYGIGA